MPDFEFPVPEVIEGDRPAPRQAQRFPIAVVLDRLRSAFNVGNIFRLAETTRIARVIPCGYTATPPHPKLAKTARGCDELVPFTHHETAAEAIDALHAEGYTVYGVETVSAAVSVEQARFRFPAAFVMGNEALGISEEALKRCDGFVSLPCYGTKNSLNVGNCCAVVLYAAVAQCPR
jgi:tRNA G18 (ribose-2'-O)-methylase SpoU